MLVTALAGIMVIGGWYWQAPVLLGAPALPVAFLWFFRDPDRRPPAGIDEGTALAPSDGRIVEARNDPQGAFVAIYLSLLDLHVIRMPLEGSLRAQKPRGGGYRPGSRPGAGHNTGIDLVAETPRGPLRLGMLCGMVARRIVTYRQPGAPLERGERVGLIRFGSRVEVTFPAGYRLLAGSGGRLRGGITPLAEHRMGPEGSAGGPSKENV